MRRQAPVSAAGCVVLLLCLQQTKVYGSYHTSRLYEDLLERGGYSRLVRPVGNHSDIVVVRLGLRLSQLIGIDEKGQILTTNVWLSQEWYDSMLRWEPDSYGGVEALYVPSEKIWLPDVVLYNNADGNYHITLMTKATVYHTGRVVWEPPATYKSACAIDIQFFPFDTQTCSLKFGSWSYTGFELDLKHKDQADVSGEVNIPSAIDLTGYSRSFVWDVMAVPARRHEVYYPCCPESYPDVTFNITIRRKTLFYTVNLIIPCVAISFLTVFVFYLPSDSGEKITLCISILLALTVFFLLLSDLIPPTSLVVPLIGKYLLFTMILVTLSIIITIAVLSLSTRTAASHRMSPWVRTVFLRLLPTVLLMKRPALPKAEDKLRSRSYLKLESRCDGRGGVVVGGDRLFVFDREDAEAAEKSMNSTAHRASSVTSRNSQSGKRKGRRYRAVEKIFDGISVLAGHMKDGNQEETVSRDWQYAAMVVDRLFLWIFTIACLTGTVGIILQAPALYDRAVPLHIGY